VKAAPVAPPRRCEERVSSGQSRRPRHHPRHAQPHARGRRKERQVPAGMRIVCGATATPPAPAQSRGDVCRNSGSSSRLRTRCRWERSRPNRRRLVRAPAASGATASPSPSSPAIDLAPMLASQRASIKTAAAPAAVDPAPDSLRYCCRRALFTRPSRETRIEARRDLGTTRRRQGSGPLSGALGGWRPVHDGICTGFQTSPSEHPPAARRGISHSSLTGPRKTRNLRT
jgi:hypothetical protein